MPPKRFSLEEANGLLPRLRRLLAQMQAKKQAVEEKQERLRHFALKMAGDGHILEQQYNLARQEAQHLANELNRLMEKAQELGCELKDIDEGLVDFRALRGGREVYLCWKLGEESIGWWHELEAGFAGRQPLGGEP